MGALYLLSIIFLCYTLGKATDLITESLRRLRHHIRVNELVASFFILGTVTSIPEMMVAVTAVSQNVPELSLGNLLGANIVVLSLLVGMMALLSGRVSIVGFLHKRDFVRSLAITGWPFLFVLDGDLRRWEGVSILIVFGFYLLSFYRHRHFYTKHTPTDESPRTSFVREIGIFAFAGALLLGASHFLVEISLSAALFWGVPAFFIGLLLISIGTNVPELAFVTSQATKKGRDMRGIATGILLGNTVVNVPIVGFLGVFQPFTITDLPSVWVSTGILVLTLIACGIFVLSGRKMTRVEGFFLTLLYLSFALYSLSRFNA